nr:PEGA domain-containing protein [Kofleriaceae bacterium]
MIAGIAIAGPSEAAAARDKYREAARLAADDDNDKALALVEDGLALAPKDLQLLELHGSLLLKTRDYAGALAAYQAYVDAGATGANRRAALKIVQSLAAVKTTFVDIKVTNGPGTVYLDAKSQGVFCPGDCKKSILPGDYRIIVERAGYDRWTKQIAIAANQTVPVEVTLVEKASTFALHVTPDGPGAPATLTLDGVALTAVPPAIPGGDHELAIARDGFATAKLPVHAHDGAPVSLDVALVPLVPFAVAPPDATPVVTIDGQPATLEHGGVAVPAGAHALVATAKGYHEQRVQIPADRAAGYKVAVELQPVGAMLDVTNAPSGADIVVDDKRVATTPLAQPVEIPPGQHAIEIRAGGFRAVHDSGNFVGDGRVSLHVGALRPDNRRRAYLTLGGTVVALGVGSWASAVAIDRHDAYDTQARQPGVTPNDPTLRALQSSGDHYALAADVGLGLGLLGIAATTYLFLHEGTGYSEGSLQFGVGPGVAMLSKRF